MRILPLFIAFWITINTRVIAQEIVDISDKAEEYWIAEKHIRIYKDSGMAMSPSEVLKKEFNLIRIDLEAPDFRTSNYWIKLSVRNNSASRQWLLEILDFGIERVAFYDIQQDSLIETGYSTDFHSREYKHKNFAFNLFLAPGEVKTYLVKVSSSTGFGPVIKIRSYELFNAYANKEYLLLGLYYGLLILIALYNFFLFISIRDNSHLFYVLYVMAIGFRSLQGDGLGFQYLWPSLPALNQGLIFAPQFLLVSFLAYAINFLELREKHKNYYKLILYSLAVYVGFYLLHVFVTVKYIQLVYLLPFFITYGVSILRYRQGYKPARFFVLAYSLFIISQIFYFFISLGIRLENEFLILVFVYGLNIGFVIETFIFSVALADKIKIFKKEKETAQQITIDQLKVNEELKDKVNRELEHKVSERTQELEDAKAKLQEQAEKINDMNRLLDLENFRLKSNVKEINIERGLLKALSVEEFTKTFPDENSCFRFIEELKWDTGFTCYKCGGQKYTKGLDPFARRCMKCQYIETIKANTIFHNLKFPIEKAFQMIYLTLTSEKEISTYQLAEKLKLQQKTCWAFRQKIMDKIDRKRISKKDLMEKGWVILIKE